MGGVQSLDASQTEVGNENPYSNHGAIQVGFCCASCQFGVVQEDFHPDFTPRF